MQTYVILRRHGWATAADTVIVRPDPERVAA